MNKKGQKDFPLGDFTVQYLLVLVASLGLWAIFFSAVSGPCLIWFGHSFSLHFEGCLWERRLGRSCQGQHMLTLRDSSCEMILLVWQAWRQISTFADRRRQPTQPVENWPRKHKHFPFFCSLLLDVAAGLADFVLSTWQRQRRTAAGWWKTATASWFTPPIMNEQICMHAKNASDLSNHIDPALYFHLDGDLYWSW